MAESEKSSAKRSKPKFLRNDWHKKIKLGRGVKKNQKWKGAKGRQNKLRLNRKGHQQRPKVGWSADSSIKFSVSGALPVRVENVKDLAKVGKNEGALIANVGAKKRAEIIKAASEKKIKILNRYLKNKENKK
jgi:ribosomal protein L32E